VRVGLPSLTNKHTMLPLATTSVQEQSAVDVSVVPQHTPTGSDPISTTIGLRLEAIRLSVMLGRNFDLSACQSQAWFIKTTDQHVILTSRSLVIRPTL